MTPQPLRRHGKRRQRGLTLIEMLVTIAVIAVGVLGIAGGIAIAEKSAGIAQGQAKLEVAMRQISDYVRADCYASSDPNCRLGLLYKPCAQAAGSKRYTLPTNPAGLTWSIIAINESRSATRNGSSLPKPSRSSSCGGNVYDWGVQEITLKVSSIGRSLTRTIWKADT